VSTPNNRTPAEVHALLLAGIEARDFASLPDLYAEDAVVDMPMAIPAPRRLNGVEEIRKHFLSALNSPLSFAVSDVITHETADPEVVIAEFVYSGTITTTGKSFRGANVQVLRVRDGLIAESRDYHDHAAIAAALTAG
jgi:ketosteroid isomerase-like protein